MVPINQTLVDKVIAEIKAEASNYKITDRNLQKFQTSPMDQECLSYVNGNGGFYCKFLALLIQKLEIKNVLELGNREGLSTLCMYNALPQDGTFTSIDIIKDLRYCPDEMFSDSRVNFIYGDVSDLSIFKNNYPFNTELLFTDTIHFDYQLRNEYSIYQNFLADSALLAIDDINVNDKRKLFDELPFPKWDLTEFCHFGGWGLVLFERKQAMDEKEKLGNAYRASADIWRETAQKLQSKVDNSLLVKTKRNMRLFLHSHPRLHTASLFLRGK